MCQTRKRLTIQHDQGDDVFFICECRHSKIASDPKNTYKTASLSDKASSALQALEQNCIAVKTQGDQYKIYHQSEHAPTEDSLLLQANVFKISCQSDPIKLTDFQQSFIMNMNPMEPQNSRRLIDRLKTMTL